MYAVGQLDVLLACHLAAVVADGPIGLYVVTALGIVERINDDVLKLSKWLNIGIIQPAGPQTPASASD